MLIIELEKKNNQNKSPVPTTKKCFGLNSKLTVLKIGLSEVQAFLLTFTLRVY